MSEDVGYVFPIVAASLLAGYAFLKRKLTTAGCFAGWIVGFVTGCAGPVPFAALIMFFLSSSSVTKRGAAKKRQIERDYTPTGHRNIFQVLANGGFPTAMLLVIAINTSSWFTLQQEGNGEAVSRISRAAVLAVVAHYAACQGDTWSSELGVLSTHTPRLILGFRKVPAGTNGGVTLWGFTAALLGGLIIGSAAAGVNRYFPRPALATDPGLLFIAVAAVAALVGSIIDSVFGQLFQFSGQHADGTIANAKPSSPSNSAAKVDKNSNASSPVVVKTIVDHWSFMSGDMVNFLSTSIVSAAVFVACCFFGF